MLPTVVAGALLSVVKLGVASDTTTAVAWTRRR